jgi:7,8-dihydropterin-6-yl-methyl-4-(beta-D-ribofuranosyl)aminobenzene 5'-phosphate synthase
MRVTFLVDNLPGPGLRSEHGLSLLVETMGGSVLFDTGQTSAWLHNLRALGRNPEAIKAVALSHGHYDHTGGLAAAVEAIPEATVVGHPDCFRPRFAAEGRKQRSIGMPRPGATPKSRLVLNQEPRVLLPGVTLSGAIPLRAPTGCTDPSHFLIQNDQLEADTFADEQCLVVEAEGRVGVLLGCSHRGVENNLLAAKELAGGKRLDLVIGGMHLGEADDDRLEALASFLQEQQVGEIACCHCTGDRAYRYLSARLGERVTQGHTGSWWEL